MVTENTLPLLEHIGAYRLTTIDAVHTLLYPDRSREAARVALYRLVEAGYLTRFEIRNRSFYQLSKKGCAEIGAPKNAAQPFPAQTLIERYAFLCFCTLRPGERHRITPEELAEVFPELAGAKGIDPTLQHYYIDRDGELLRLGRVTVDNGSEVGRLAQKCREIAREAQTGDLRAILESGAFVLTVLTTYATKRARLLDILKKQPLSIPVQVEVIPQMKHLL